MMNAEVDVRLYLTVYLLEFTLEASTPIHLGRQAGAQIRGALWTALERFACTDPRARSDVMHQRNCPMCRLVAMETFESARGINPPRPFAVRPPLSPSPGADIRFKLGEEFTLGINLFGSAADLLPYVCQAIYQMGEIGIGYGRGQFIVRRIRVLNALDTDRGRILYKGSGFVLPLQQSDALTHDRVYQSAEALRSDRVTLQFVTPAQIINDGHTDSYPKFDSLISRLLERCQALETFYGNEAVDVPIWRSRYLELSAKAADITSAERETRWLTVKSGSRRTGKPSLISGFVGRASFTGDITAFRYWLLWGTAVHIGKNVVKGNGWYRLEN